MVKSNWDVIKKRRRRRIIIKFTMEEKKGKKLERVITRKILSRLIAWTLSVARRKYWNLRLIVTKVKEPQ